MRRMHFMPLVLVLLAAACSDDRRLPGATGPVVDPIPTGVVQLRGFLEIADDSSVALRYAGHPVPLLGVSAGLYAALDGAEVVVEGKWEGEAFRVHSVQAADVMPPQEPQLRMP